MFEFIKFYLSVQFISLAFIPLVFYIFKDLQDKGYFFSKAFSIFIAACLFWIFGMLHFLPNQHVILIFLALLNLILWALFIKKKYHKALKEKLKIIIFCEILFFAGFMGATLLRAFVPEIWGTEKLFEFMILNSIHNSNYFPPYDAWFGGNTLSYYHFGYIIIDFISRLSQVPTNIAFNLAISLTWALSALSIFGLVFNLHMYNTEFKKIDKSILRKACLLGFVGILFLLILGNLEGVLEFMAIHGIGGRSFYSIFGVEGLNGFKNSLHWYPDELWFWWRATRLTSSWNVMEFPFFSFLLGDLHPHLIAIPYFIVLLGIVFALVKRKVKFSFLFIKNNLVIFLALALFTGGVGAINVWYYPISIFIVSLFVFITNLKNPRRDKLFIQTIIFIVGFIFVSFLFLASFLAGSNSAVGGILPNMISTKASFMPIEAMLSSPVQIILFWLPLISIVIFNLILNTEDFLNFSYWKISSFICLLPILLWIFFIYLVLGTEGLIREIFVRPAYWYLSLFLIYSVLFMTTVKMLKSLRKTKYTDSPTVFSDVLSFTGVFLIMGAEFFYVNDVMAGRYNTLFKFYFIAWILLAISSSFYIEKIYRTVKEERRYLIGLCMVTVLIGGLIYPIIATTNRIDGSLGSLSLDGTSYAKKIMPEEYEAINWINKNIDINKNSILLEASGKDYSLDNLISAETGMPSLIGWVATHELLIRNQKNEILERLAAVEEIYTSQNEGITKGLIDKYKIKYVYVGPREIDKYGSFGMGKFDNLGKIIFKNRKVKLYKI